MVVVLDFLDVGHGGGSLEGETGLYDESADNIDLASYYSEDILDR